MRLDASDPGNGIFEDLCFNFCKVFSAGIFWWVRHCINPTKCFESSWCWRKALYNINVLIIIISVKKSYVPLPNKLKGLAVVDFLCCHVSIWVKVLDLYIYIYASLFCFATGLYIVFFWRARWLDLLAHFTVAYSTCFINNLKFAHLEHL